MEEPSFNTQVSSADFLVADTSAKHALVEKLAKLWSQVPADPAWPSAVDEEQVAIAKVRLSLLRLCVLLLSLLN